MGRLFASGVIPDGVTVLALAPSPVGSRFGCATPEDAIDAAGGVPASRRDAPLLVVINDPDRATRTEPVLRAIRERIGARPIEMLVATGSHRWSETQRAAHETPLRVAAREPCSFRWHDGRDAASHAAVADMRLDRALVAAADVVAVGSVEPHWFAGLTGAHKGLTVGTLLHEDLECNHRLALEPGSRPFALDGNPVHEGLVPAVAALCATRRVLAVEHVEDRWFAGAPLDALRQAEPAARLRWRKRISRPLDFVITRIDPPLSRNLYQAEKGVKHAEHAVRDGGAIILDAACEEGVGPSRFVDLLRRAPDEAAARTLVANEGYRLGDHKAVRLRALTGRGVELAILSPTFDEETARVAGFAVLRDLDHARRWLASHVEPDGFGAIIEDGGHVVPELEA